MDLHRLSDAWIFCKFIKWHLFSQWPFHTCYCSLHTNDVDRLARWSKWVLNNNKRRKNNNWQMSKMRVIIQWSEKLFTDIFTRLCLRLKSGKTQHVPKATIELKKNYVKTTKKKTNQNKANYSEAGENIRCRCIDIRTKPYVCIIYGYRAIVAH